MPSLTVKHLSDLTRLHNLLTLVKLPITVSWVQGVDRTGQQNNLQMKWAKEVADQLGDRTPDNVRADWKLRHGMPILRDADPAFQEGYDRKFKSLHYEEKVRLIELFDVPVTRLMKVPQMIAYLDAVQRECVGMGLTITHPDGDLSSYHDRYRAPTEVPA